jgi:ankyrin repeat protein
MIMGDKLCSIAHNFMSREVINLLNCCDFTYVQAGWTPLHLACKKNQSLLAKLLVSKGADINAKDAVSMRCRTKGFVDFTNVHLLTNFKSILRVSISIFLMVHYFAASFH